MKGQKWIEYGNSNLNFDKAHVLLKYSISGPKGPPTLNPKGPLILLPEPLSVCFKSARL
jgi:hypothetical protein